MSTILEAVIIGLLAFASLGGGLGSPSDTITPMNACAPGDAAACRAIGGEWFPQTCSCL